jgi:TolB-like protein/Tfp pilus assembly protein PilF
VTGRKLNYVLAGLIIVLVGYIVALQFFIGKPPVQTKLASTLSEETSINVEVKDAPKTIAVLPFADMSPDKDQEYFVDGLSEELLNCLAKIQDLQVIARTSSFAFKGTDKTIQEIADVLGANHILEGSVRKSGNSLRITAQLIRAADGIHLWTETYDRKLEDIFDVQEDIATTVANELKIKLGVGNTFLQLGGTDNMEAYELYLVAKGQNDANLALPSIDASIAIDPKFALAWVWKAFIHAYYAIFGPADRAALEQDAALQAAMKSIELEPNLAEGYACLGWIKTTIGDYVEAGLSFRKAFELATQSLSGDVIIGAVTHYLDVGYFKKAHEILEEARQNDPLHQSIRAFYIMTFENIQQAEKEYERGRALFGDQWFLGNMNISFIRLSSRDVLSRDEIVFSNSIFDVAKEHLDSPKEGLAELDRIYTDNDNLSSAEFNYISIWAAYFGDPEFALEAIEKSQGIEASGVALSWMPFMHEVRQLPRFKEFVREIGLVDYWEKFGWPDICRPLDDGDFVCD